jgi:hypothetical protein
MSGARLPAGAITAAALALAAAACAGQGAHGVIACWASHCVASGPVMTLGRCSGTDAGAKFPSTAGSCKRASPLAVVSTAKSRSWIT